MTSIAEKVVDAIIEDLNDRSGLGFDSIDAAARAEIRTAWIDLVEKGMRVCPFCARPMLGTPLCGICDNDE